MPRSPRAVKKTPHRSKNSSFFAAALALLFAGLWVGTLAATNQSVNTWLHATFPEIIPENNILSQDENLPPVFENDGKTYVAFDHSLVNLTVVTDSTCTEPVCDYEKILNSIYKEVTPGITLTTVDVATDEGKALLEKYQIGGVPAFLFDQNITTVPVYTAIADYLTELNDNLYLLMTPFGKYYSLPDPGLAHTIGAAAADAKTTIIAYESFSCAQCKNMVSVLKDLLATHADLRLIFKHFDRGNNDSLLAQSAECAGDQGKFWEMEEALFATETPPEDSTAVLAVADTLGLNQNTFQDCLDTEKYKDRVAADTFEGKRFGVLGTPTFFINGIVYAGAFSAEEFEQILTSAQ